MESFWNSTLFQTCILIATACITLWIYFAQKRRELRNAITILTLQIRDIENNIEYLLAEGIVDRRIQEKPLHYSTIIFEENNWNKFSHLIVGKISQLSFENVDNFFKVANRIREQQLFIKTKLQQSVDYKGMYYYNGIYTRVNSILDRAAASHEEIELQKKRCHEEINFVHNLYGEDLTNIPSYVQQELVFGLEKTLKQYHKLTDGTAYAELEKLKK